MAPPSGEDVANRLHMGCKDKAEKKARLAVCTIACGQEQSVGCGVLVSDQHVVDLELSEHCIITINEVVHASENKTFKGKYQATFQKNHSKPKTLDLQNITKKLERTASGLVLIFLNSSCTDLNHKDKKCSILSESPLSIGSPCHSSPLFCFVENQRYNVVKSTGENGEECVLKADGDTAKSANVSAKEIPQGTVILQDDADDKNLMAVGILKVVNKKHFSPIWFKSSLNDLLAAPPPSSNAGGQTSSTSDTVTAISSSDSGQPSMTTNNVAATSTTDSGQPSTTTDNVAATTPDGPQSTGGSGDTPANTTDKKGLPAAGSDTTEDKLKLQMNAENVPNSQEVLELLVADQSISKAVTNDEILLEKLSKKLDRETRHIRCWKHLAFVLEVPPEERGKFDRYTEHSPTEDMFNYLDDVGKTDLKVKDLKTKLKDIYRNDVIERLNEEKYDDEKEVSELISRDDGKFIGILSSMLDTEMNGWKSLAPHFEITHDTTVQFGLPGPGPTAELFFYMSTTDGLKDLTVGELRKHFEAMKQKKLVNILPKDKDSSLVTKEAAADSDLLEDIGKRLNKNTPGLKNWRRLAYRLKIPLDVYNAFDTSKEVKQGPSPTKMLFKWLEKAKQKLTVKDLLNGLRKINRYDVVQLVIEEVALALKKKKTQVYLTEQALYKLQLLRHDTDQAKKDKNVLLADLREKAAGQGLTLIDNDGLGNCMFSALCHQLKIKKRLKQYSEMELRTELAQYLKAHPELNDFVDQKEYPTWTDYVNKMASNGHWGDGVTLLAAARHLHCDVRVISNRDYPDVFLKPDSSNCDGEQLVQLVLGHIFDDHFVSLEPVH